MDIVQSHLSITCYFLPVVLKLLPFISLLRLRKVGICSYRIIPKFSPITIPIPVEVHNN